MVGLDLSHCSYFFKTTTKDHNLLKTMTGYNHLVLIAVLSAAPMSASAFQVPAAGTVAGCRSLSSPFRNQPSFSTHLQGSSKTEEYLESFAEADAAFAKSSADEKKEKIGSLIADDEWLGLAVEMTEVVRTAVVEDVKKKQAAVVEGVKGKTTEFIGKEEYKVGDILKTLDEKVKKEVANMRGKDEYELGDLTVALDKASKDMACKLTGKDAYETGDLSREVDGRIKKVVAAYCGKDEYEVGDLTREIKKRVAGRVAAFTGKDEYAFGDIAREVNNKRQMWAKDYLGDEAWENYVLGDLTKKAIKDFKADYKFGDVTKKVLNKVAKAAEGSSPTNYM